MIFWLVFLLLINFKVCCIDWGFCHKGLFSLFLKVITNITKLITHNLTYKLLSQYGSKALFVRLHSCINFHNFFFINLSNYLRVVVYKGLMILKRYRKTTFIILYFVHQQRVVILILSTLNQHLFHKIIYEKVYK